MAMAAPKQLPCLIVLLVTIFSPPVASSFPLNPITTKDFTRPLIPPTNPRSPFYPQVLKANNISTNAKNITLGRSHYREWLKLKLSTTSSNYADISFTDKVGYAMDMFIGDPFQYVFGQLDTGSELVWFQCEGGGQKGGKYRSFRPSKSSTYKQILCGDQKLCDASHDEIVCDHYEKPCTFKSHYEDKTYASGIMSTDVAMLSTSRDFLSELRFGCSTNNSQDVLGIIGAGIGEYSLPTQLDPNAPKLSYCISYDISKTNLVKFRSEANFAGRSTEVLRNKNTPFYYLDVLSIQVNGRDTDVPPYLYEMSLDGSRGFIIDSGTAITHLATVAFDGLKKRMTELLGKPTTYWMFEICYPPSRFGRRKVKRHPSIAIRFPEFRFVVPRTGTWEEMENAKLVCLLITRTEGQLSILGYEQLFDVNVGHDVGNDRLYLMRTKCPTTTN